jgi:BirA family biotin operon repressor/biotin-[acetyl-CoA-carboxylase] ligase
VSLDQESVSAAVLEAGIEVPARFVEVTGSTNADLIGAAEDGAPEWTVLVARDQRSGRGRLGRTWLAPPGSSLLVSVLLRPTIPAPQVGLLSLAAAVAMARAGAHAAGVHVRCKWPNDLVCGDRKVGGILAESVVQGKHTTHVVIGAGVNVTQGRQDFPADLRSTATSVVLEGGRPELEALLRHYLSGLRSLYGTAGEDLWSRLQAPYLELSATIGRGDRGSGHCHSGLR